MPSGQMFLSHSLFSKITEFFSTFFCTGNTKNLFFIVIKVGSVSWCFDLRNKRCLNLKQSEIKIKTPYIHFFLKNISFDGVSVWSAFSSDRRDNRTDNLPMMDSISWPIGIVMPQNTLFTVHTRVSSG